jgi:hypothetical protein
VQELLAVYYPNSAAETAATDPQLRDLPQQFAAKPSFGIQGSGMLQVRWHHGNSYSINDEPPVDLATLLHHLQHAAGARVTLTGSTNSLRRVAMPRVGIF